MKRLIVIVSMLVVASQSAFAGEDIPSKVLNRFEKEFFAAKNVKWNRSNLFIEAQFTYNEKVLYAFYTLEGQFMGVSRNISPAELPVFLQSSIKNNFPDSWITDLFELSNAEGLCYYLTLENSEEKIILKSQDGRHWRTAKSKM